MKKFNFLRITTITFVLNACADNAHENSPTLLSLGLRHSCEIRTNGTLWCWGYNKYGQLGDGTTEDKKAPVQVGDQPNWAEISAGLFHTCGIKTDGTLWCWGFNGADWVSGGQLGIGTTEGKLEPAQVGDQTNWTKISCGEVHTCAIKTDGTLWCWGNNYDCQLGDGTTVGKLEPVQVGDQTNWAEISAGRSYTCGIKTDGTLWCWGLGYEGQLGLNHDFLWSNYLGILPHPVQVGDQTNWAEISAGYDHTCAIKTDGTLWCWGYNRNGQLGIGTRGEKESEPVQVGDQTTWADVSAKGHYQTCGRMTDGTLWCWGWCNEDVLNGYVGDLVLGTSWKEIPVKVH